MKKIRQEQVLKTIKKNRKFQGKSEKTGDHTVKNKAKPCIAARKKVLTMHKRTCYLLGI